jgi:hypothetical protein
MAAAGVEVGSYKPSRRKYIGPPMDLDMRKNGVRSLWASCLDCHHHATVNVTISPTIMRSRLSLGGWFAADAAVGVCTSCRHGM